MTTTPVRSAGSPGARALTLIAAAVLAAWGCGPASPGDEGGGEETVPGSDSAAGSLAEPTGGDADIVEDPQPLRGMMTYMADAASFTECLTGAFFPIATEGDYLALEREYLARQAGPGEPLLVSVRGRLAPRPGMEGDPRVSLVVDAFEGAFPGVGCGDDPAGTSLEGIEWVLTDVDGFPVPDGVVPTLLLSPEERRAVGSGGCNSFSASYTLSGGSLTFGAIARTRSACPSPLMDVEERYARVLGLVGSYHISGTVLELLGEDGPVARFRARGPARPARKG